MPYRTVLRPRVEAVRCTTVRGVLCAERRMRKKARAHALGASTARERVREGNTGRGYAPVQRWEP